jgi:hypothetical protein
MASGGTALTVARAARNAQDEARMDSDVPQLAPKRDFAGAMPPVVAGEVGGGGGGVKRKSTAGAAEGAHARALRHAPCVPG